MEKLILHLEKEIEKASKEFRKAGKTINKIRDKHYRDWSDKECEDFDAASKAWQENERILCVLRNSLENIKGLL